VGNFPDKTSQKTPRLEKRLKPLEESPNQLRNQHIKEDASQALKYHLNYPMIPEKHLLFFFFGVNLRVKTMEGSNYFLYTNT
jgi:hypothetical protein